MNGLDRSTGPESCHPDLIVLKTGRMRMRMGMGMAIMRIRMGWRARTDMDKGDSVHYIASHRDCTYAVTAWTMALPPPSLPVINADTIPGPTPRACAITFCRTPSSLLRCIRNSLALRPAEAVGDAPVPGWIA